MKPRSRSSSNQAGTPDLFTESLYYPREELCATVTNYIEVCLGFRVSDEDFHASLREVPITEAQCLKIIEVIRGSNGNLAELSNQTDDAEIAFLIMRLILGCVF